MSELSTAETIRLIASRRSLVMGAIAESTEQTRQNFSNKMKRGDFKESELRRIAEALGCDLKISFVDKVSREEF